MTYATYLPSQVETKNESKHNYDRKDGDLIGKMDISVCFTKANQIKQIGPDEQRMFQWN